MKIPYHLSASDYVKATRLFSRWTAKEIRFWMAIASICLLLAWFGPASIKPYASGGLVGGLLGWPLRQGVILLRSRWQYPRYSASQLNSTVELLEDGIRFSSAVGEFVVTGEQIGKWRHDRDFILIYRTPALYHIIPKVIADQGFELAKLMDNLIQQVGQPV